MMHFSLLAGTPHTPDGHSVAPQPLTLHLAPELPHARLSQGPTASVAQFGARRSCARHWRSVSASHHASTGFSWQQQPCSSAHGRKPEQQAAPVPEHDAGVRGASMATRRGCGARRRQALCWRSVVMKPQGQHQQGACATGLPTPSHIRGFHGDTGAVRGAAPSRQTLTLTLGDPHCTHASAGFQGDTGAVRKAAPSRQMLTLTACAMRASRWPQP